MIDTKLTIRETERLTDTVFRLKLEGEIPPFVAGQFVHLAVPGFTLRRPFCIAGGDGTSIDVVFATVGAGTLALSRLPKGTRLDAILPIGNGFPIAPDARNILILGGGLGVAPLLPILAQHPDRDYTVLLGFGTSRQVIEREAFECLANDVRIATDDGSLGYAGRVTELAASVLRERKFDAAYVCGPTPMIRAAQALEFGCPAYVSMEARMGCGVGACLVCTCPVSCGEVVRNLRVCVDGPVFPLRDVRL